MKWLRTLVLFDKGKVVKSADWRAVHDSYVRSIQSIEHPTGSASFIIRRKTRGPDGKWIRNGVNYLRENFLHHIVEVEGWRAEGAADLGLSRQPPIRSYPSMQKYSIEVSVFGDFDLVTTAPNSTRVAIEW